MKRLLVSGFIGVMIVLASCQGESDVTEQMTVIGSTRTPTIETIAENAIQFRVQDVAISVQHPPQWETFTTEYGVVLAESLNTVATEGQIDGLFIHVWLPPLEDITLTADSNSSRALRILRQIVTNPDYVGDARVSAPQPLSWEDMDAAFYLMDNNEGSLTIVLGIVEPQSGAFVAASVSAPARQMARIRAALPDLLDGLTIGERSLSGASLAAALPDPLQFP